MLRYGKLLQQRCSLSEFNISQLFVNFHSDNNIMLNTEGSVPKFSIKNLLGNAPHQ